MVDHMTVCPGNCCHAMAIITHHCLFWYHPVCLVVRGSFDACLHDMKMKFYAVCLCHVTLYHISSLPLSF